MKNQTVKQPRKLSYILKDVFIARGQVLSARRYKMFSHINFFILHESMLPAPGTVPVGMYRIIMAIIPGDE